MRLRLFGVGVVSILGQVVLLRELAVASYGVELVYLLAMGAWLLGGALGSLGAGRLGGRATWLLVSVLLPCSVVFARASRTLFGTVPGAFLPLGVQLAIALVALAPTSALLGALFVSSSSSERSLGRAYAIESAGGLAGGLASTLLLSLGLSNWFGALACASMGAALACMPWGARPRGSLPLVAPLGLALAAALLTAPRTDFAMTRWNHPALTSTRDTPYGRVSIESREGLVTAFRDDALAFETEGTGAEELVNVAATGHPAPRRMLIVGSGWMNVVVPALRHPLDAIDVVDPSVDWRDLLLPRLPPGHAEALRSPKVGYRFEDPRAFLAKASARWDLLVVAEPEPSSAASNRFFTREFFTSAKRRLAAGGILALELPSAENHWTPALARRNASVARALESAFDHVLPIQGSRLVLVASDSPLERNPGLLETRLRERQTGSRAATPEFLRFVLESDRTSRVAALLAETSAPANSDSRPACYRLAAALWLSRVAPSVGGVMEDSEGYLVPGIVFLSLAVLLLLLRAIGRARTSGLAVLAGFAGMLLEGAVVLHFQSRFGVLFEQMGLLFTAFMLGLAGGAWGIERADRPGLRAPAWAPAAALGILSFAIAALLASGAEVGLIASCGALALAGGIGGAAFATAAREGSAGSIYAADLAGGCLAALAGSVILFPMMGIIPSLVSLGTLAALGALLTWRR